MSVWSGPSLSASSHSLTLAQRDAALASLAADGYAVLPLSLPPADCARLCAAVSACADAVRATRAADAPRSVKLSNAVDAHPLLLELALYPPALELAHDVFGCGAFHLNQSNVVARPRERESQARLDFVSASPWHADGPRPAATGSPFPSPAGARGAVGLHYLKFGYFFSDLTHGNGGSLEVVRGSHLRAELDGKGGAATGRPGGSGADGGRVGDFDIADYAADLVKLDVPAGTVVAFHQAQWHAALPNQSDVERLNAYVSFCPTWMRPLDRETPAPGALEARGMPPHARWLLGEPRPALRFWIPTPEDLARLDAFARPGRTAADIVAASGYDAATAALLV